MRQLVGRAGAVAVKVPAANLGTIGHFTGQGLGRLIHRAAERFGYLETSKTDAISEKLYAVAADCQADPRYCPGRAPGVRLMIQTLCLHARHFGAWYSAMAAAVS